MTLSIASTMNRYNAIEGDRKKLTKRVFENTGQHFNVRGRGNNSMGRVMDLNRTMDDMAARRNTNNRW